MSVLLTPPTSPEVLPDASPLDIFSHGCNHRKAGNHELAIKAFECCLRVIGFSEDAGKNNDDFSCCFPKLKQLYFNLASSLHDIGLYEPAVEMYSKILHLMKLSLPSDSGSGNADSIEADARRIAGAVMTFDDVLSKNKSAPSSTDQSVTPSSNDQSVTPSSTDQSVTPSSTDQSVTRLIVQATFSSLSSIYVKLSSPLASLLSVRVSMILTELLTKEGEVVRYDNVDCYNFNVANRMCGRSEDGIRWSRGEVFSRVCRRNRTDDGAGVYLPPTVSEEDISTESGENEEEPLGTSFLCVKYGTKYGAEYVNKLVEGIRRHLPENSAGVKFICYTDDSSGIDESVEIRPLGKKIFRKQGYGKPPGWWYKSLLFRPPLLEPSASFDDTNQRMIYIDLDTVVTGPLERLLSLPLPQGMFYTLSTTGMVNENRLGGINTSVMIWRGGCHGNFFSYLDENFRDLGSVVYKFDHWAEMYFLSSFGERVKMLQEELDGRFILEYKQYKQLQLLSSGSSSEEEAPGLIGCSIVTFPLNPKPKEVATSGEEKDFWVVSNW